MSHRTTGQWFEDIALGDEFETFGRTVTETDLVAFIGLAGLYEEIFQNAVYAEEEGEFRRRVIPGLLTLSLAEGLVIQTGVLHGTGRALLSIDMRAREPVAVGDTIHVRGTVTTRRPSRSRPELGVVVTENRVLRLDEVEVMRYEVARLIAKRHSARDRA